ncbi:dTDP-4-dehydrorhamnose reductase [Desulfurispora thermophila]|uniref:dTDP-4-dehydrorhamnose reductase n=1 Tax=Desulfurispora thermophila TaxID=265470 RepID=UPI0003817F69|nr:dTDP-4-dehydrorhamnose reductase [Desulfurispora thermophila]
MQKVLITGANGQLGRALQRQLKNKLYLVPCNSSELDITSFTVCRKVIMEHRPDVVINAAAYTNVERAEEEPDAAFAVNAIGAHNLALACRESDAKLVHISTDYVFDGSKNVPYGEYDVPNPLSVYGKSKLWGENLVREIGGRFFIVRTSWLYGDGKNFVRTMLRLAGERQEVAVVADQQGSPTYAGDLAAFLEQLMQTEYFGTYHATNAGSCTWYDFARQIFAYARKTTRVRPIKTEEYPVKAKRPRYSVLDNRILRLRGFAPLRSWQEALAEYIQNGLV